MSIVDKIKEELKKTLGFVEQKLSAPELKISDLVIGGKVELVNEDQTLSDAPDGEYTVGEDLLVVKDGLIHSINGEEASKVEEEVKAEETPDVQLQIEEVKSSISALSTGIQDLWVAIEEMKSNAKKDSETADKFSKELKELNETLKTLVTVPAEFSRTNQSIKVQDSKEQKMGDLFKAMKALK